MKAKMKLMRVDLEITSKCWVKKNPTWKVCMYYIKYE